MNRTFLYDMVSCILKIPICHFSRLKKGNFEMEIHFLPGAPHSENNMTWHLRPSSLVCPWQMPPTHVKSLAGFSALIVFQFFQNLHVHLWVCLYSLYSIEIYINCLIETKNGQMYGSKLIASVQRIVIKHNSRTQQGEVPLMCLLFIVSPFHKIPLWCRHPFLRH